MLENLKRIREPLAWILVVIIALQFVLRAVLPLVGLATGLYQFQNPTDLGITLWTIAMGAISYPLALALLGVVVSCAVQPAVGRLRTLANAAAWVVSVAVAVELGCLLFAALQLAPLNQLDPVAMVSTLLDLLVSGAVAVALWALVRDQEEEAPEDAEPAVAEGSEEAPEDSGPAPVWSRSEATGTVWRTADEAASGAPGAPSIIDPPEESTTSHPAGG